MKTIKSLTILVMALFVSGCYTTGLSVREKGVYNYSNFVYGLYGEEPLLRDKSKKVKSSISIAVAQIGETAPPKAMLERLRVEKDLITKVIPLPAGPSKLTNNNNVLAQEDVRETTAKMRYLSKDLGADYLFLFGGSADYRCASNFLQVFDISIVGAYILPSYKHTAEGRASGVLVDVATGEVQLIVSSEGKASTYTPSYMDYGSSGDGKSKVLVRLRDDLVYKLSDAFIEELKIVDQEG